MGGFVFLVVIIGEGQRELSRACYHHLIVSPFRLDGSY